MLMPEGLSEHICKPSAFPPLSSTLVPEKGRAKKAGRIDHCHSHSKTLHKQPRSYGLMVSSAIFTKGKGQDLGISRVLLGGPRVALSGKAERFTTAGAIKI